jgi:hypothetical protein
VVCVKRDPGTMFTSPLCHGFSVDADANGGWSQHSVVLEATSTDHYARLSLTSGARGVFWLDQVSAMPTDTFKVGKP